ncbi:hypothetical protein MAXJ12_36021 [Mesorhizobium alhagi CCNWXJ12-2]|uniref:Uncharacterized protein n=1 Tax=Mesorhizobium alhagi CCNWXJ12-2 TaxID=1107882 RepID=H0I3Y5_9HYPH|nr:hypothetical protein MAXJ12_36021 [Mesorhizobium alhagi CCNWXJ12-2]
MRDVTELAAHFGIQLSIILHLNGCKTISVPGDEFTETSQQLAAPRWMHAGPLAAVKCGTRGSNSRIYVARVASRD